MEQVVKVDEQEEETKDNEAERKVNYEKVSAFYCSWYFGHDIVILNCYSKNFSDLVRFDVYQA